MFVRVIYDQFSNPDRHSKLNRTGVQLLGVVVSNKLAAYNPTTAGSVDEYKWAAALQMCVDYDFIIHGLAE